MSSSTSGGWREHDAYSNTARAVKYVPLISDPERPVYRDLSFVEKMDERRLFEFLQTVDYNTFTQLCQTNKAVANFCGTAIRNLTADRAARVEVLFEQRIKHFFPKIKDARATARRFLGEIPETELPLRLLHETLVKADKSAASDLPLEYIVLELSLRPEIARARLYLRSLQIKNDSEEFLQAVILSGKDTNLLSFVNTDGTIFDGRKFADFALAPPLGLDELAERNATPALELIFAQRPDDVELWLPLMRKVVTSSGNKYALIAPFVVKLIRHFSGEKKLTVRDDLGFRRWIEQNPRYALQK